MASRNKLILVFELFQFLFFLIPFLFVLVKPNNSFLNFETLIVISGIKENQAIFSAFTRTPLEYRGIQLSSIWCMGWLKRKGEIGRIIYVQEILLSWMVPEVVWSSSGKVRRIELHQMFSTKTSLKVPNINFLVVKNWIIFIDGSPAKPWCLSCYNLPSVFYLLTVILKLFSLEYQLTMHYMTVLYILWSYHIIFHPVS